MPGLSPYLLPAHPQIDELLAEIVAADYHAFAANGPCKNIEEYVLRHYDIDLTASYGGYTLCNPWGKASGQLSMTAAQVRDDVEAGLAFIVLKTVIAEDADGRRSMGDWAVKESRMAAERIVGVSGESGWTISWKGRGWWQSFDDYLQLIRDARQIAHVYNRKTLIVPSCKYHLPANPDEPWKEAEYEATTDALLKAWGDAVAGTKGPMPLEKDFSPTLAGSDRSRDMQQILDWLRIACAQIRLAESRYAHRSALYPSDRRSISVEIGLKLFNALFNDEFQLEMLRTIHKEGPCRPDFFVYGNRLFDPQRSFDDQMGIAYGGPDLSDRNLRVMSRFQKEMATQGELLPLLPWSATGNIQSGRMALEYALRGASSFQLHTFFQLPAEVYAMKPGSKTQKALHELYFHPQTGLIVWMHHIANVLGLSKEPIRFLDLVGLGRELHDSQAQ